MWITKIMEVNVNRWYILCVVDYENIKLETAFKSNVWSTNEPVEINDKCGTHNKGLNAIFIKHASLTNVRGHLRWNIYVEAEILDKQVFIDKTILDSKNIIYKHNYLSVSNAITYNRFWLFATRDNYVFLLK